MVQTSDYMSYEAKCHVPAISPRSRERAEVEDVSDDRSEIDEEQGIRRIEVYSGLVWAARIHPRARGAAEGKKLERASLYLAC
jgi:hypothetical protein